MTFKKERNFRTALPSAGNCCVRCSSGVMEKEQDSTMGPNFAVRLFVPWASCWGAPSPNPASSSRTPYPSLRHGSVKARSFRRSSSPHTIRFAGIVRDPRL